MTLGELIAVLEKQDPEQKVAYGFDHPHSYRGYYEQLAFGPARNVTVGSMLACAKEALGTTYEGWKGGDFTMKEYTECHLSKEGTTGEELGPHLLGFMLFGRPL